MDGKTYSYLELAALPDVGATLLDPHPAFVFSADGARLLFGNAAAASFFDQRSIGDLLDLTFSDLNPLKAQAARLSRVLPTDTARLEMLRVGQGTALAGLAAACRRLNLEDGGRVVLAIATNNAAVESLTARAERLADAFGSKETLAAVMNAEGRVLAASGGYDALARVESAIDAMIAEARGGGDAIVKRALMVRGGERPAGAVRFRADGRTLFLLLVGPVEQAVAATAVVMAPVTIAPVATPEPANVEAAIEAPKLEPVAETALGEDAAMEAGAEMMFPPIEADDADQPDAVEVASGRVVGFVFATDAAGRFTLVSPDLATTVGEENGALAGLLWADVVRVLGFDAAATSLPPGPFSFDLAWPAENDETVPVTLTGAPVFDRQRAVIGYRGFGAIRPDDPQPDGRSEKLDLRDIVPVEPALLPASQAPVQPEPEKPELTLASAGPIEAKPIEPAATSAPIESDGRDEPDDVDGDAQRSIERGHRRQTAKRVVAPTFTERRAEPPAIVTTNDAASNIVRLPGSPSRSAPERLTGTERDAFRRIAEALGQRRAEIAREMPEAAPVRKEITKAPASDIDTRLLDRLPIGIAVFRDHKTLFANRTLLDQLDYDAYDAFVAAGGTDAIFPGRDGLASNIAEAGGRLAATRRDGSTVPVKAWLHAITWAGSTALMLSLSTASTGGGADEDAMTVELARVEARAEELEGILDTATDGVIVIDGRGKIGTLNRAAEALFGVKGAEYAGRYFTDLLADESQKAALDYLDGLASNGVASVLNDGREVIGRVPAGGLIPLFMTMGRIGTSDKFCAVLRDITQWKNAEEELIAARRAAEAANAQKSEFLAKISHEIRTPLNAIIGFSEVMMGERFGPIGNERYRSYLHDIHVSGDHLLSLINDLLDLSKIEAGKVDLSFESVAVNSAIQECVALMQPQANRERIIIRTSLAADVPNVVADQRAFRQILLNLLSNAVKFTRAGGQVIVSSSLETSGEVTVRIRDTGIGMSEKDIETALKPFRQVAVSKDDREHGTGLGLPLTKALVEANRATFAIDSAPNQGTLVRITFPTTRVLAG